MRKNIVAANWKMNLTKKEALSIFEQLEEVQLKDNQEIIVFSPYVFLDALKQKQKKVKVGAQNFHPAPHGAYTGKVSINHLLDLEVECVLIGHSERRMLFNESDELIKTKIDVAVENKLEIVFCCGEPIDIRNKSSHCSYVLQQMEANLFHLDHEQIKQISIAYEPVWAIGTGKTATTEQAENMHRFIRMCVEQRYGFEISNEMSILYGGSCNATNSSELFACENIDGGLIGGASLKAEELCKIISSL
ncbi:MAG: triose-phosphate isomerase [Flavobacteriia bacterium]|nr:triose-phosphate isomerase [Flavobacteriia bacterium]